MTPGLSFAEARRQLAVRRCQSRQPSLVGLVPCRFDAMPLKPQERAQNLPLHSPAEEPSAIQRLLDSPCVFVGAANVNIYHLGGAGEVRTGRGDSRPLVCICRGGTVEFSSRFPPLSTGVAPRRVPKTPLEGSARREMSFATG